jgi:hypothetical protein
MDLCQTRDRMCHLADGLSTVLASLVVIHSLLHDEGYAGQGQVWGHLSVTTSAPLEAGEA